MVVKHSFRLETESHHNVGRGGHSFYVVQRWEKILNISSTERGFPKLFYSKISTNQGSKGLGEEQKRKQFKRILNDCSNHPKYKSLTQTTIQITFLRIDFVDIN
jgi:hypothetical protein